MSRTRSSAIVIAAVGATCLLAQASVANAQAVEQVESGSALYKTYCVSCHGPAGHGDGAVAPFLKVPPANLVQIAKRNNGAFPSERIAEIIDGSRVVKTHGASQMPVWGDAFSKSVSGGNAVSVTAKIKALVEYLDSIQEKPAKQP